MRFILILLTLLGFELFAVETVQDDTCMQKNCQNQTAKQVKNVSTEENKNGTISVSKNSEKALTATSKSQACKCNVLAPTVKKESVLKPHRTLIISVIGQGVAPVNTTSPAQAYALAKRAAIADGYRLIAEKVKGVEIEGQDLIKNMMVKRSSIRTAVYAMVKNANVIETNFRDGLCEVEMEIKLSYDAFIQ